MPAEIEIPFYFSMKGLASENPAFLSKQLSGPRGGGLAAMERGGKRPVEGAKLLRRLPSRPSPPLFADKKTNLPQGNSFSPNRRDCAAAFKPRILPDFAPPGDCEREGRGSEDCRQRCRFGHLRY